MNCREISKLLDDYLLDKIESDRKKLFEQHLKSCPICHKKIEFELQIKKAFHDITHYEVPVSFKQKILTQIPAVLADSLKEQKTSFFKKLSSWLKGKTLIWLIGGVLAPLILGPLSFAFLRFSEQIGKTLSQVETALPILNAYQMSLISFIIACSFASYGLWRAYKFFRR